MLGKILFKIGKGKFVGNLVGITFQYFSYALPVKRTLSTKKVIGFYHPKPCYKEHMLLVPKKDISNLIELSKSSNTPHFLDVWSSSKKIATEYFEKDSLYVLCGNGGKRQDIKQVHFHLFKDERVVNPYVATDFIDSIYEDNYISIIKHPNPNWELHLVIIPSFIKNDTNEFINEFFPKALTSIKWINSTYAIEKRGYTFVYQGYANDTNSKIPVFHIVAGKKLM